MIFNSLPRLVLFITIFISISVTGNTATPIGQAITYSNFNYIRDIASSTSHVFFATTNGIIIFNKFTEEWEIPVTGKYGIDDNDIYRVWVGNLDRKIFVQTSTELLQYDSLVERWYPISELPQLNIDYQKVEPPKILFAPKGYNYLNDGRLVDELGRYYSFIEVIEEHSGDLWLGTWGQGAAKAFGNVGHLELLPFGLLQERVNTVYQDEELLWISGDIFDEERTGISIYDPEYNEFEYIESGVTRNFPLVDVNCIRGNDSLIYAGTELGITVIDRRTFSPIGRITAKNGMTDENVISLAVSGDSIFAGTEFGLNLILPPTDTLGVVGPPQLLDEIIYDLEIVDTTLWIASSRGAYRWYWTTGKLQQFQDPHLIIFSRCLALDRWKNFLWLASNDGLLKLDLETGDTEPYPAIKLDRYYRALSANDTIAVTSSNLGMTILFHDNPKPYSREFTTDDGLPSSNVYELILDGDYVWIGSDKGLTRFWWNNPSRVD